MRSSVEPLEGNKVKLSIDVEEGELDQALADAFRRISREVRIPGFRPGKAPRKLLEARLGPGVARQEALREALPKWYEQALDANAVDAIAPPDIDITSGDEDGAVSFDAVVEVRPKIFVPGYANLRVVVPSPEVADEEIDGHIDRLREQHGELSSVDRAARDGDHVSIDIAGSADGEPIEGLTADDYLYEVGSGGIVPQVDEHLRGAKVGDILVFDAPHPDPEAGTQLSFRVLVKEVKEKVLPEADDEFANEASEFETLAELRDDIRQRLSGIKRVQSQLALRQGAVDSLVQLVEEEAPAALVDAEVERRAHDLVHRLQDQGATVQQYLEATGRTSDDLGAELRSQAADAVKADLALRAVIEAELIEATDEDVEAEIARLADRMQAKPAEVRRQIEHAGRVEAVRSDVRKGKALEWLVEHAEVVDEEGRPIERSQLEPPTDDQSQESDAEEQEA